jgi:hypothetical protein
MVFSFPVFFSSTWDHKFNFNLFFDHDFSQSLLGHQQDESINQCWATVGGSLIFVITSGSGFMFVLASAL